MNILFVCTGNTCRSPLAAAVARQLLRHAGVEVQVESAGTAARAGERASDAALQVAREAGLELGAHRARPLTATLLQEATLVLVMGTAHLRHVQAMLPGAPAHLLSEYAEGAADEIPDPFGGDLEDYRRCLARLRSLVERGLQRFQRGHESERI